ncbi:MAG: hypothetical protein SynsKO_16810 [Synoicihabitans sp.]
MTNSHFLIGFCLVTVVALAQREPEVLVVSETFGRPLEETRPTQDNPISYHLLGGAQLDFGGKIRRERMPDEHELERLINDTLASQGFRRMPEAGPTPDLIVTYAYGSVAVDLNDWEEAPVDDAVDTSEYLTTNEYAHGGEILRLIGADRMQNRRMDFHTAQLFRNALQNDRLYITVSAMGTAALMRQQREIIWRTKISIELDRNTLPDAMGAMMASAAPHFGIETEVPVFMDARDRRETEVKIGDLKVVDPD